MIIFDGVLECLSSVFLNSSRNNILYSKLKNYVRLQACNKNVMLLRCLLQDDGCKETPVTPTPPGLFCEPYGKRKKKN